MWKVTEKNQRKKTCITRLHDQIIKTQNNNNNNNNKKTWLGGEIIKYVTILFEIEKSQISQNE